MPLLCSTLCPDAHTAAVVAGERVHASAITPDLDIRAPLLSSRTPSNLPGAVSGFASPFSFLAFASRRDELEPPPSSASIAPRHYASIPRTQSRATSPRPHSAPSRACSSCSPANSGFSVAATIVVLVELRPPLRRAAPPTILRLKSIFAQNESCRFSFPLQLLFWPNFKFLYEKLSFNWSNSG